MFRHRRHHLGLRVLLLLATLSLATPVQSPAAPPPSIVSLSLTPDPTGDPPGVVVPNVRPRADADRGTVEVRGVASPPGIVVELVVTDDLGLTIRQDIPTVTQGDPSFGVEPGSFRTDLHLTDLGRHSAIPDALAPDDLGRSTLTLRFSVFDESGVESDHREFVMEKRAATPGDVAAPALTQTKRPPPEWCHVLADHQGNCFAPILVPNRPEFLPSPWSEIGGHVEDFTPASLGAASEIADVIVRIFRPDGSLYMQRRSFLRNGTRAHYSVALNINDFEPNAPLQPPYRYSVIAYDAWGRASNEITGTFNVYAF